MTEEKKEEDILLSEEEVWDIVKFASGLSGISSIYGTALTPFLLNERMKDMNLTPMQATDSALASALADPKNSETELQAFSQDFEIVSQPYKRVVSYLTNMLSFDMTYTCMNATGKDYKSSSYNKSLDVVKQYFDRFDYRQEFNTVTAEMLRNEAFFCCPRMDMSQIVLQELTASPSYTMITGRWDYGLLFSFNMMHFLLPGVDINLYPDFFKKKYGELWDGDGQALYKSSMTPMGRGASSWVYWQDIPVSVGHCFKLDIALATRLPYFTGLFSDLIQQPVMRALQKSANMSTANRMIIGEVGTLKDTQSKVRDQFNISPALLGNFLALVKSAIGEAMKVAAVPLNNAQPISFPAETGIYSSYLRTALSSSGINTNLLFAGDQKMNAIETQLSLETDEQLMTKLYPQFEDFLNYRVNKEIEKQKCKHRFKFQFEGTKFSTNRTMRLDNQIQLATGLGIVMPQKIGAAIGMNPFEMERHMEEARETGWVDKLTPIISAFQQSAQSPDTNGGRPRKKESELTESGSTTRSQGSNIEKGGKV